MTKLIVALVGHPASGKSSAAKYLEEKHGFTIFTFSKVIRDYALQHGIELKRRADYASTHARMLKEHGWNYTLRLALGQDADRICIDDLRSSRFAEVVRDAGGVEIAFHCPPAVRYAHGRGSSDTVKYPHTEKAFIESERQDNAVALGPGITFDTDAVMQAARYHIDASGTLDHTYHQLEKIMSELLNSS